MIVCAVTVGRLVYISLSAVADSLQFATEKVNLKSLALMRARLLQFPNMDVKFELDVTAVVTNAGTDAKEPQLASIPFMFVTAAVLNSGTDVREMQLANIAFIETTAAVSNSGTYVRE